MINQAKVFLEGINQVFTGKIDDRVKKRAVYALLDYICVTLAGAQYNRDKLEKYISNLDSNTGQYKIIGFDQKATIKDAIFINGLSSHSLDYDDGTNAGIIHLGSPLFSTMISLCEKHSIDNDTFYRAVIAGYEASFSMAYSIQPEHKKRGYHATGTCGIIGATLAICYALSLNEEVMFNALSTASMAATGMLKVLDEGSELKPFNVAKTALLAYISVEMALAGFIGPEDPFGGERGLLAMLVGRTDLKINEPLIGGKLAIERAYIKPYAACRYCHPSIECAIELRKELIEDKVDIQKITQIDIKTYKLAVVGHEHKNIPNVSSSKMSIPYSVAVALTTCKAGLYEYSPDMIKNPEINRLLELISVEDDEKMSAEFPQKQMARVQVIVDGKTYTKEVDIPRGEPENPLSESDFKNRFYDMCKYSGKEEKDIFNIYDAVFQGKEDIKSIVKVI